MEKLPNGRTPLPTARPRTALAATSGSAPRCKEYQCTAPATQGYSKCARHRAQRNEQNRRWRRQQKEKNKCIRCQEPAVQDLTTCEKHRNQYRRTQRQRQQQSTTTKSANNGGGDVNDDDDGGDHVTQSSGAVSAAPDHRANEIHDPDVHTAAMALLDMRYSTPR